MNPVFVYGILKGRHDAKPGMVPNFRLIDMGSFPAAIPSGGPANGFVRGELIYVDDATIEEFDRIEGAPNFYKREKVTVVVQDGDEEEGEVEQEEIEAEMYVVNKSYWDKLSEQTPRLDVQHSPMGDVYTYSP